MKIYFAHPQTIDYQAVIYQPVKSSQLLSSHECILPHDDTPETHRNNTRDFYRTIDLMIAEVSAPATGLGIELGWAADDGTPIYCFYQEGTHPSGSIYATTDHITSYTDAQDFIRQVEQIISQY